MNLLEEIAELSPFRKRNAEEYRLDDLLDYFVNPAGYDAFSFSNCVVKGPMGAGKSMFLKANQAFYKYSLVPSVLEGANSKS